MSSSDALERLLLWAAEQASADKREPRVEDGRRHPWGVDAYSDDDAYRAWWASRASVGQEIARSPKHDPSFLVVVSTESSSAEALRSCIAALQGQSIERFAAVLAHRSHVAAPPGVAERLRNDPRFSLAPVPLEGPSGWLGSAGGTAHKFLVMVDGRDLVHPNALAMLRASITPDVDVLYSDEDEFDEAGAHCHPRFKPDWAPDLLLSQAYLGNLMAISFAALERSGWPELADRHDLALRVTEVARQIVHVPEVLYHRRIVETGTSPVTVGHEGAVRAALARRGIAGAVEPGEIPGTLRVRRPAVGRPSVAIVIPFRDQAPMLARCVESILEHDDDQNLEIVLVDNGSIEPETAALCARLDEERRARIISQPGPFNWSAVNNAGAAATGADFLLFLNNDIEVTTNGWLAALLAEGQRAEVGIVGARLLYGDGSLQHAGIVVGAGVIGWHVFMGMPPGQVGYLGWDRVVRPCSAVTGACLLTPREVFARIGGFDEALEVAFNDVDYCLRVRDLGYEVIYTPDCTLVHHEAASRGLAGYKPDGARFLAKWDRDRIRADPYFNPNLSRFNSWCPLRGPGEDALWEHYVDELARGGG
jgi:GT2 family glycosyltransferase